MANILVFSWRGPGHPLSGGAEQVMHEHMKGWVAAGHSVTLFTSHYKNGKRRESLDGVKIIRQGIQYWGVHILGALHYLFGGQKYDLVVDQFHGWPFFTPLYVKVPKIAVIQELTREVWYRYPLPFGMKYILGPLGFLLEPLFFVPYKNIIFITGSESAKRELSTVRISTNNVIVIPHGVIIKKPSKKITKEKISTLVFLGALASDKGIEDAIKTFGILNKKREYQFWIIGKGEEKYLAYLKNLAKKVGIGTRVVFWGFVSQEKKFELLARAHIMINPSIREGWGLVNIEANSMGTPVVAYNSPGLTDSVQHGKTGVICKYNSPGAMAQEIQLLLADKTRYKNMVDAAIEWSHNFDWKKSKKKSLMLIEDIVKLD